MRAACLALLLGTTVWAAGNGAGTPWTGVVRDTSGKAVPGARIELRSASGNLSATASESGEYRFTSLTPGTYRLTVRVQQQRFVTLPANSSCQ